MEYAISDIHGCYLTFRHLVEQVLFLRPTDILYLLGDYVDRGPASKEVIDYIMELQAAGYDVRCLKGNHEDLLVNGITDRDQRLVWLNNGGLTTMQSFDIRNPAELDSKYLNFFQNLLPYIETDAYWLVHAGFNFRAEDMLADTYSMYWIRGWYADFDGNKAKAKGKKIIHGHTPQPLNKLETMSKLIDLPYQNIDGGCFARHTGYGHLCAYNLTTQTLVSAQRIDIMFEY
jgi:serine/threonine protein phosphatase 1